MAKLVSQSKLDKLRRKWQRLLRLQDWKIKVKFASQEELNRIVGEGEPCGACHSFVEAKEAVIYILNPEEWTDFEDSRVTDVENTIVHELLHCHFSAFDNATKGLKLAEEQTIEVLAEVLLMLDRRENG